MAQKRKHTVERVQRESPGNACVFDVLKVTEFICGPKSHNLDVFRYFENGAIEIITYNFGPQTRETKRLLDLLLCVTAGTLLLSYNSSFTYCIPHPPSPLESHSTSNVQFLGNVCGTEGARG